MATRRASALTVNGRSYAWPDRPLVVMCIDGCEPDYVRQAIGSGAMPYLASALPGGTERLADCVVPSFTNPNNLSIVTGAPPAVHGISGNFALDRDSGAEIMMTDPEMVRGETILALMSQAGVPTAAIDRYNAQIRALGTQDARTAILDLDAVMRLANTISLDSFFAVGRALRIGSGALSVVILVVPILNPFRDVSAHVIKTPVIRVFHSDWMNAIVGVAIVPS